MPTAKTIQKNAKIGNEDLRASFSYRGGSPAQPDAKPPVAAIPATLVFSLHIEHDDGSSSLINVPVNTTLTNTTDRNKIRSLLIKLRDAAFVAGGYTTS